MSEPTKLLLPFFLKDGEELFISKNYPHMLAPDIDIFPEYVTNDIQQAFTMEVGHEDEKVFLSHTRNSFIKAKESGLIDSCNVKVGYFE
jgi:hypothetical protein